MKEDNNKNDDSQYSSGKYYENIIQKPKIMSQKKDNLILQKNVYNSINNKISMSVKRGKMKLPSLIGKK